MSFFSRKEEKTALLIDIGNGSITGAIALFQKNSIPEFLYSLEVPFIISEKANSSKLVEDMLTLLNTLLQTIAKEGWRHPYFQKNSKKIDGSLITFSSPWFFSKTKHLNLQNENFFVITKSFVENILKQEESEFKKELGDNKDFKIVEKNIVHTKINGYTLDNSIGKKTKALDAYLYMSVVSEGIIRKVEELILKYTHIDTSHMLVHTFPLVSFTTFRDLFANSSDFLMIDVTGEVTDVTLVQNDVIIQSVSMPSGRNFLVRQIMKTFKVASEIAESTLALYMEEKLNPEDTLKMDETLIEVEKEWSIYLENALSELSSTMTLPGTVYFTSDDDISRIYINFLKLSKVDSTAQWRKGVSINHIDKEATEKYYKALPGIKTNEFVGILSLFYKKVLFG